MVIRKGARLNSKPFLNPKRSFKGPTPRGAIAIAKWFRKALRTLAKARFLSSTDYKTTQLKAPILIKTKTLIILSTVSPCTSLIMKAKPTQSGVTIKMHS